MPLEGFGVFQIPDAAQCEQVTYEAIQTGYRLIDTAAAYMNEEAVGKAVARAIADGITTRDELFITTKVWVQDMKTEETAYAAVKASLQKLGMEYVDLILLHQPMGDYFAAYRGIEKAYRDGLTKAIGVANFYPGNLTNLCENVEILPAVNQVELHPFFVQQAAIPCHFSYTQKNSAAPVTVTAVYHNQSFGRVLNGNYFVDFFSYSQHYRRWLYPAGIRPTDSSHYSSKKG